MVMALAPAAILALTYYIPILYFWIGRRNAAPRVP